MSKQILFCALTYLKYLAQICTLADSGFFKNFLYQGGVKSIVSWVFEDLKFKISEGYDQNWADSGKHQFWSEPSEILNLWSSNTPKTVGFTPP